MQVLLSVVTAILFLGYGIVQIIAGYMGVDYHFGAVWAGVAIVAALMFRFTLPITIGAFFCAMDVWGWHWALAVLFAFPGLASLVPSVVSVIVDTIKR